MTRILVRRFGSGVTHVADVPDATMSPAHWITDYTAVEPPVVTLCAVTLRGDLIRMLNETRDKHVCRQCRTLGDRTGGWRPTAPMVHGAPR